MPKSPGGSGNSRGIGRATVQLRHGAVEQFTERVSVHLRFFGRNPPLQPQILSRPAACKLVHGQRHPLGKRVVSCGNVTGFSSHSLARDREQLTDRTTEQVTDFILPQREAQSLLEQQGNV